MDKKNIFKKSNSLFSGSPRERVALLRGFTLVELIVVIAIIGLLVTLSLLALSNARVASRDSKRMADIKQLQTALELFYDAQDRYPTNAEFQSGSLSYFNANLSTTTYISIPTPPAVADGTCSDAQNGYSYDSSADGSTYTINFCTAKPVSDLPGGKLIAIPGGIVAGCYTENDAQFCARQNKNCDSFTGTDNCGQSRTVASCGTCTSPNVCAGGGIANQCGCAAETDTVFCSRLGYNCGSVTASDNCGHSRTVASCGTCVSPDTCGSGSKANKCVFPCGVSVAIATLDGHACNTGAPDYDTCSYPTVNIGTQCWMTKNINVGSFTASTVEQIDNSTLEKYCYSNLATNCPTDGGFYQWNETMQYSVTEGAQGICPSGWHVPTDAEQNILDQYLKTTGQACDPARLGNWGCSPAGTALKVGGTSGFNVIMAGYRYTDGGFFEHSTYASIWSSSLNGSYPLKRYLRSTWATVGRYQSLSGVGYSVRCLKSNY